MTVVLKSNKNAEFKIRNLIESLDVRETTLTVIVSEEIHDDVEKTLSEMGYGVMKYGREKMHITKTGVAIHLMKIDKYI